MRDLVLFYRKRLKITQSELAAHIGKERHTLSRKEIGQSNFTEAEKIKIFELLSEKDCNLKYEILFPCEVEKCS